MPVHSTWYQLHLHVSTVHLVAICVPMFVAERLFAALLVMMLQSTKNGTAIRVVGHLNMSHQLIVFHSHSFVTQKEFS